jgi:hypothetical protein
LLSAAAPADWSLLCADALLSVAAAPVELEADWSAEGVVELAADWSLLGVVAEAPAADWSAAGGVVLAAPDADWSAEGVVLAEAEGEAALASADGVDAEADPAGVVAEAEAEGEVAPVEADADGDELVVPAEADWSVAAGVEGAGGGALVLPVPDADAAVVSAVGCAPLLAEAPAAGAAAPLDADWSELGMVLLPEAEGVAALLVVVVVWVVVAPAAGAADAPVVLHDSEIIFMSATLNLLSEPIEPVTEAWCPTCASRPLPSSL